MAKVHGFPGYAFATVPHPVASLDAQQLRDAARGVLPDILTILGVQE
jgi:hypothetical protein